MVKIYRDANGHPLSAGDKVKAKVCVGPYGLTRTVRGVIRTFDPYGVVIIVLDGATAPFVEAGRTFKGGDSYDISGAFSSHPVWDGLVGYAQNHDPDHHHTRYCHLV